ncbi:reactive Intermediate Deaminase A, chloroplastic [Iris pallida]|uniref:Reactive Intermediate Deaminase A, chloroplastic n=1 Tax=Iris pallida TaxID=29817 RepID=A0AAX6DHI6_IRIPA|nr:reactive Intermediate Deaminase A, chloroplastic [Iris pallida]
MPLSEIATSLATSLPAPATMEISPSRRLRRWAPLRLRSSTADPSPPSPPPPLPDGPLPPSQPADSQYPLSWSLITKKLFRQKRHMPY